MILYTCGQKKAGPAALHPCAKAGKALDAAGYEYEIKTVKGAGITGGGLFNSVFTGHGSLGLMCEGNPLVIPVSHQQPVFVEFGVK